MRYYLWGLASLMCVTAGCRLSDGSGLKARNEHVAPPAAMMMRPGPMVDGPGPGVLNPMAMPAFGPSGPMGPAGPGAPGAPGMPGVPTLPQRTQVRFINPQGMVVGWQVGNTYAEQQVTAPGRYDFLQGGIYRLKLTNIPGEGREGLVLYPTMQIYPAHPTTQAYLSHVTIPIEITDEDLDQISSNNFVTKVIYLPNPKFQELAIAGVETLVSTRLEPGVDPVQEAERRGTIMAVMRLGNVDMEMPGQPGPRVPGMPEVKQMSYQINGAQGQIVDPLPIGFVGQGGLSVPSTKIMATSGAPGMPAYNPMPGMGSQMPWGMPITATPIGLPGPPHLPYGGPASLKSHTIRNKSKTNIPEPVDHMLIDVRQDPAPSLPKPVKYIQYEEKHPNYAPGQLAVPAWATGPQPGYGPAPNAEPYCPPGQVPPQN